MGSYLGTGEESETFFSRQLLSPTLKSSSGVSLQFNALSSLRALCPKFDIGQTLERSIMVVSVRIWAKKIGPKGRFLSNVDIAQLF